MTFQKGYTPWNKGKNGVYSEETRKNMSEAHKGKKRPPFTEKHRRRLSDAHKGENNPFYGKHHSEKTRRKQSEAHEGEKNHNYGKHFSEEHRRNMSEAQRGEKNHNWKGGYEPYRGPDWQSQRRLVRERDDYTCLCGLEENGREHDVHHIVPYRISRDNSRDNLWTLCPRCHPRIETMIVCV